MYIFKENISENEFCEFIKKTGFAPIQQTSAWAILKDNWQNFRCGLYEDEALIGVALILTRRLMPGFTCAYCPRGPVTDFGNTEAVKAFADGVREFCKKRGIYEITIDPQIVIGLTLPDMAEDAYFNPFDVEEGKRQFENLVASGFTHKGFGKDLHSTLQPRFNAMIPLCKKDGTPLSPDALKKNYRSKIRKYYGSFQTSRGLFFEKAAPTDEELKTFKTIIQSTEQRQKISLRGEEYFRLLSEGFGDEACFAFEKCDVSKYIAALKERLEKEPENREKLLSQLEEAERVVAEKGSIATLAALLTVFPPNEEGVRVAEYLYAGSDLTSFPAFRATLCGLYEQCLICIEKGCHFLDLGGFAGTFDDGLFEFKNQFNPICTEYAGEFTMVISPVKYKFMNKALPTLKKIYKKLFGRK